MPSPPAPAQNGGGINGSSSNNGNGGGGGANLRAAAIAAAIGGAARLLLPLPAGVEPAAWDLLGFFVATVAGLVLEPLPAGAWALVCAGAAIAAGAITFEGAFAAADTQVLWLIVLSFLLARGFDRSGLGERAAQLLVARFGGSTRGLAASLAVGEALIAPGMPSTTARAAGIFLPVIKSVSAAAGSFPGGACARAALFLICSSFLLASTPCRCCCLPPAVDLTILPAPTTAATTAAAATDDDTSRRRLGAYLVQSQLQASSHTCSLVLTASAQNLLCLQLAESAGVEVGPHFAVWSAGALLPGVIGEARGRGAAAEEDVAWPFCVTRGQADTL